MIVVDASVIVELLTSTGRRTSLQERLAHEHLAAPDILPIEVASALRGLGRGGHLDDATISSTAEDLARLPLDLHPSLPLVPGVLALRENLSAYDASYVALAAALGRPLLTYDRRLVRAASPHCEVEAAP